MNKKAEPEISLKSTKEQILTAYKNAMALVESKPLDLVAERQKETAASTVTKATQNNPSNIITDLATVKNNLIKHVDNLSTHMVNESNHLEEIRQAINIEQTHLNDLYNINESAKTLSALILAQQHQKEVFEKEMEEEKAAFEQEMNEKRNTWKNQQETTIAEYKELKENLEKARKREEEEYKYNLELTRKKEMDVYANQKSILEKELTLAKQEWAERETALKAKEMEFNDLKKKVDGFSLELVKTKEEAEKTLKLKLETDFKFVTELRNKEIEGDRKLNEHKITVLEKKIAEQDQLIEQLTSKADATIKQIQQIACRALDTSAQRYNYPSYQSEDKTAKTEK